MESISAWIAYGMILLIGWFLFLIALSLTALLKRRPISLLEILKDFRQKILMTAGLGTVFFGLYFFSVYAVSFLMDNEKRMALFFSMYQNPISFIYLGLFLFAFISTTIYLVRLLIKFLCNKKRFF